MQIIVELLPLATLEERAAMCSPVWGRCHGIEEGERIPCCSSMLKCVVKSQYYGQCLHVDDEIPYGWEGSIIDYTSSSSSAAKPWSTPAPELAPELAPAPAPGPSDTPIIGIPIIDIYQIIYRLSVEVCCIKLIELIEMCRTTP